MGTSENLWFMFKITIALMVLKTTLHWFVEKILNMILYVPDVPSRELKAPCHNPPGLRSPGEYGFDFDSLEIITKDQVKISGWFIKQEDPIKYPTLIFFHGNAGNMGNRIINIKYFYYHCKVNTLIIDYRGYGTSKGSPNERGLKQDAEAALNWCLKSDDVDNKKIFIFGRSLGGAVAIDLCHRRQEDIAGIILENTFCSIRDMTPVILPVMSKLVNFLIPDSWPSIKNIDRITTPIFFISGRKDSLIPPKQMDRLYNAAVRSKKKYFFEVKNGEHNDTWCVNIDGENLLSPLPSTIKAVYFQRILKFIQDHS
ncbi:unnamed protein product [Moneuplotes crassus]|uniref:Serine aminopeptidase S33 domain-containing protein n=1 Tax=Euplotes crassus TaxID=5936 RepID=A0AAD1XMU2_EUPCR|nr:unnamed protein product [Moneuplotes crassus]